MKAWLMAALVASSANGALAACVDVQGNLQQGGLVWGQAAPGARVLLDGDALDVLEDGTFVAGFSRDAAPSAVLQVGDCRQTLEIAAREYNIQRVEGVPQRTVTPPPEQLARIARERELVNAAKAQHLRRPDCWPAPWPVFIGRSRGAFPGCMAASGCTTGSPAARTTGWMWRYPRAPSCARPPPAW